MNSGYRCRILPRYQKASPQNSPVKNSGTIVNTTVNDCQIAITTENIFSQIILYVCRAFNKLFFTKSSGNGTVKFLYLIN